MKIVTSIGLNRLPRQKFCIDSWLDLGLEVVAVQSDGETRKLEKHFPEVKFVETTSVGELFRKPHMVRVCAIFEQARTENILVLNSDIEIRSDKDTFLSRWSTPEQRVLKVGIRWNEDPITKEKELLQWGIDAFLITPRISKLLPDVGMTIGCPAWDYWVIIHLTQQYGYTVICNKEPELIHEIHSQNWSKEDYKIGLRILQQHTGMGRKESGVFIREITGR